MTTTSVNLYRSVRKDDFPNGVMSSSGVVTGTLYPSFKDTTYHANVAGKTITKIRKADVYPYSYGGQEVIDPGGGTSLFDKDKAFGTKHWWYFTIPVGTVIPDSLRIRFTGRNDTYGADHYQIEASSIRMPVDSFKAALDNLARNAIAKQYEDARK
ncbi:hypothetical protein V8J88_06680 [Massilia sp. W12]|uniref:Tse2 family ADP-ribosyltransferase toxin n=1 Tax=Massilia sp. W12 TaxID=3126507 RepID=UPI0030D1537F